MSFQALFNTMIAMIAWQREHTNRNEEESSSQSGSETEMTTTDNEHEQHRFKQRLVHWRIFISAMADSIGQIMTCAMIYLVPLNYSILILTTYPIMQAICGYFLINRKLRLYEVVTIFVVLLGMITLF